MAPTGSKGVALLGGMTLLEEVCHFGQALRFQMPKPGLVSLSLPAVYADEELSATFLAPRWPACCHASQNDNNGLKP